MKKAFALLVPLVALPIFVVSTSPASAQVDKDTFQISATNFNDCTQEDVDYTGTFHSRAWC